MKGQDAAQQRVIESNMHEKLHEIGYGGTGRNITSSRLSVATL